MPSIRKTPKNRMKIIQILIAIWLIAICSRLAWLQVKEQSSLSARADRQQQATIPLTPMRGVIFDRNGNELARSSEVKSLYAYPGQIVDAPMVAIRLAKILDMERGEILKRLQSTDKVFISIKRKLTDKEVEQVEGLNFAGLRFINEMKRSYLNGSTAAHVLGFVDVDENGLSGLERTFDEAIRGKSGKMTLKLDALKKPYGHEIDKSIPGSNINLTIDATIQHYAEQALQAQIQQSNARGGTIVMMRPATGEILALANYPTFDPNDLSDSTELQKRNRAIEIAFEPGSIFKIVAYSAALEEHLITPDSKINCENGSIMVSGRKITDASPYGILTAAQALAKSSNVAAIKIGQMLGYERLAHYIDLYGFGQRTKIELPAESRGIVRDVKHWSPTLPIGYGIGVTAVQTAAAFSAVANGGIWIQPHLVQTTTTDHGEIISQYQGESRKVIRPETAETLKSMLEGVVVKGTAKAAQMEGYRAAGKTGTAQKAEGSKGYTDKYVASFAGFAPVNHPEIVCVVSIDEPVGAHHGGDVAAPVFAEAVSHALQILGVEPENATESSFVAGDVKTFDVQQLTEDHPASVLAANEKESPDAPTQTAESASKESSGKGKETGTKNTPKGSGEILVPDLSGRGIREAVALCSSRGLKIEASGEGIVSGQSLPPGSYVAREAVCRVRLGKPAQNKGRPDPEQKKRPAVGEPPKRVTVKAK